MVNYLKFSTLWNKCLGPAKMVWLSNKENYLCYRWTLAYILFGYVEIFKGLFFFFFLGWRIFFFFPGEHCTFDRQITSAILTILRVCRSQSACTSCGQEDFLNYQSHCLRITSHRLTIFVDLYSQETECMMWVGPHTAPKFLKWQQVKIPSSIKGGVGHWWMPPWFSC